MLFCAKYPAIACCKLSRQHLQHESFDGRCICCRWGVALEALLGGTFNAFICDTPAEARVLSELCARAQVRVNVNSAGFHHAPHHIKANNRPPQPFISVADVLRFGTAQPSSTVISNFLIDRYADLSKVVTESRQSSPSLSCSI